MKPGRSKRLNTDLCLSNLEIFQNARKFADLSDLFSACFDDLDDLTFARIDECKTARRKERNGQSFAFSRIRRRTCRIQIFRTRRAAKSYFNNHFRVTRTPRWIMHPRSLLGLHLLRWHTWPAWWTRTIHNFWPNWKWRSVEREQVFTLFQSLFSSLFFSFLFSTLAALWISRVSRFDQK